MRNRELDHQDLMQTMDLCWDSYELLREAHDKYYIHYRHDISLGNVLKEVRKRMSYLRTGRY